MLVPGTVGQHSSDIIIFCLLLWWCYYLFAYLIPPLLFPSLSTTLSAPRFLILLSSLSVLLFVVGELDDTVLLSQPSTSINARWTGRKKVDLFWNIELKVEAYCTLLIFLLYKNVHSGDSFNLKVSFWWDIAQFKIYKVNFAIKWRTCKNAQRIFLVWFLANIL